MQHIIATQNLDKKFGILEIQATQQIQVNDKHKFIIFSIDVSGSMLYKCSDGRTKLEQVIHTLKNIIQELSHHENISICIQIFHSTSQIIVEKTILKYEETYLSPIIEKISKINPGGMTNIECALQNVKEMSKEADEEEELIHLLLTDGEITEGSRKVSHLRELASHVDKNIFIGFGLEHNSLLLNSLLCSPADEYRFIDSFEHTGMVYGEILYSVLFGVFDDVIVGGDGVEIYDFLTNQWVSALNIGGLYKGQTKTIHFRKTEEEHYLFVSWRTPQGNIHWRYEYEDTFKTDDLWLFSNRQKTQEYLYKVRKISETNDKKAVTEMKNQLKQFYDELMQLKNKNPDILLLKMLCEDIYVAYKTLGTEFGNMFACARQSSNGREQAYVCSNIPDNLYDDDIGFTIESSLVSPYVTGDLQQLMNDMIK
jgi:hypothetical protein